MPAINAINGRQHGHASAPVTTLTASDTITRDLRFKQILMLRNSTVGALTLLIDGADGGNVNAPGFGTINTGSGYSIPVAPGESRFVDLATIDQYTRGVVTLSGASGLSVQLFNL